MAHKTYKDYSEPALDAASLNDFDKTVYGVLGSGAPNYTPPADGDAVIQNIGLTATTGASKVGADDSASGAKFTTVQGGLTHFLNWITTLAGNTGASLVGFLQAGTSAVLRTVQAKLREQISVADFGAVGAATDESAKIQAAINYANSIGGGTVTLPKTANGYNIGTTGLTLYPNVVLQGVSSGYVNSGNRGTVLYYSGTGSAIYGQNLLDSQIRNIVIDCFAATGANVNGFWGNGIWKSTLFGVTVRNIGTFVTASITGNTLTVTGVVAGSSTLAVGQNVIAKGLGSGVTITALGTGTGGAGTYTISVTLGSPIASTTMVVTKGVGIRLDTDSGFGGQHNLLTQVEVPDSLIALNGNSGSDGVTTTTFNTIRGFMYYIKHSQGVMINATAEGFPDVGFAFDGIGTKMLMLGCDIEGSGNIGINITGGAEVTPIRTIWAGWNGTTRISGTAAPFTAYGAYESQQALSSGNSYLWQLFGGLVGDGTLNNFISEYVNVQSVTGGAQAASRLWKRYLSGTELVDHDWSQHMFVTKQITTTSTSAALVLTIPIVNATGIRVSVHAWGQQLGDSTFSSFRDAVARNDGGTVSATSASQLTVGSPGQITFVPNGSSLEVRWTPITANSSVANFNIEIRGQLTVYS